MSLNNNIRARLHAIIRFYSISNVEFSRESLIINDLFISEDDYIEFIEKIEKEFQVNLQEFIIGDNPEYIYSGFFATILNKKIPVFRDFSVRELEDYISKFP